MKNIIKLFNLLNSKERKRAYILLIVILFMAVLDMLSVASFFPFITAILNPKMLEINILLKNAFIFAKNLGITEQKEFVFLLGVLAFVVLILSLIFKAVCIYMFASFAFQQKYSFSSFLVERFLGQPYTWFLSRSTTELSKTILSEIDNVVENGLLPLFNMISQAMIVVILIIMLSIIEPIVALSAVFIFSAAYITIYLFVRDRLRLYGDARLKNNQIRYSLISEIFGAFKEIKVGKEQKFYLNRFNLSSETITTLQSKSHLIGHLPRFVLEGVVFGGAILIILILTEQNNNSIFEYVPVVAIYVLAGYRIMPAMQQIFFSMTQISFTESAINDLSKEIISLPPVIKNNHKKSIPKFEKEIALKNIHFNYENKQKFSLEKISLKIPVNTTVGLVGPSGSGKTTITDLITGLLEAKKGSLEVDGQVISKYNRRAWQSLVGYVPQNIFLSNDTIAANIALGLHKENIDEEKIKTCAKIANLHNFVFNQLPLQYETKIGENGKLFSGGQRQRIGIARALYRNPKLLILDEATNALSKIAEFEIINSLRTINKNITILIVTHRLSSLKNCDNIFVFDKGRLKETGKFDQLIKLKKYFNKKNI
jgi:ABC-type multidrug transport system fused ATPase/permease subunit